MASNVGTWMQGVGAAWLMTDLSASATLVAAVQAANYLPMFLLAVPGGALADVFDRRRVLLVTQGWMAAAAAGLALLTALGIVTPGLLLLCTFLLGVGAAVNLPAWQAVVPELVPREDLASAVTLGSMGFNLSRAAGPALGGLVVAAAGPQANFALNALSFLGVVILVARWRRETETRSLPSERLAEAMTTGLRYVRHAPEVQAVVLRGSTFVLCASALWALLPLVARRELGLGPEGYGALLAAFGTGAVAGGFALPRLRRADTLGWIVSVAAVTFAAALASVALVRHVPTLLVVLAVAGGSWLCLLSSLNVAIQTSVPSWVRARALSVYMLSFFGGLAGGSALWGAVAERFGLTAALATAAAGIVVTLVLTHRARVPWGDGLDLAPSRHWPAPIVGHDPDLDDGPVLVTLEYRVAPEDAEEFSRAMAAVRRARLRSGAFRWRLFEDAADPCRVVEMFLVKSWAEHLRQHERVTGEDREAEQRIRRHHAADTPPRVRHWIARPVPGTPPSPDDGGRS